MSADEYVPSEFDVCNVYAGYYMQHSGKTHSEANAEFVRFIERYTARVRRDAAREALSLYLNELVDDAEAEQLERFRDQNYPEESP